MNEQMKEQEKVTKCECDMRTKLVGDGCRYCNPQYWIDHLIDERDDLEQEVKELQNTINQLKNWWPTGHEMGS